jgi:hypothetical protein
LKDRFDSFVSSVASFVKEQENRNYMPLFDQMPVCYSCGVPCHECRNELDLDIPRNMTTAQALLDWEKPDNTIESQQSQNAEQTPELKMLP